MTEFQSLLLVGIAIVLLFDLLVAAARTGFLLANPARLRSQHEGQEQALEPTFNILNKPVYPHAAWAIGQGIFRIAILVMVIFLVQSRNITEWSSIWLVVSLLVTGIVIAWLEWLVEEQSMNAPEDWALRLTTFTRFLTIVMAPLIFPLAGWFGQQDDSAPNTMTEDELVSMMETGKQEGVLEEEERQMIVSIFRLGDTLAREIMIPRIDIVALDVQTTFEDAVELLLRTGHSRVPVYEESIDNVLGVLYSKDLLKISHQSGEAPASLRELLREAYFIPEAKKVDELLAELQDRRVHMAIVVDEYGGVAGLVTLEDIVEEIVGEIQDEYDQAEELPYQQVAPGEYVFQGRMDLDDFNEIMGSKLPVEEAETLGGFIYGRIGRVPTSGETLQVDSLLLTVAQVTGRRIRKVRAQFVPKTEGTVEKAEEEKHDES